jgi:predicted RNA-binding protein with PIN domain
MCISLVARAVINKWPKCAVHFAAGDLAAARDTLMNEVLGYAAFRGTRVALGFPREANDAEMHVCGSRGVVARITVAPLVQRCRREMLELNSVHLLTGIKVVVVFDATTSAQSEAQRESVSEHVDVVYSAAGGCFHLLATLDEGHRRQRMFQMLSHDRL